MILFINTASPEIIMLALLDQKGEVVARKKIQAKYKQSEKLLAEIKRLSPPDYPQRKISATQIGGCPKGKIKLDLKRLRGIIAVKGPGSFTALRIGLTTANAMAFALGIPIVGVMDGEFGKIVDEGMKTLKKAKLGKYVMPEYGMEPNITLKH